MVLIYLGINSLALGCKGTRFRRNDLLEHVKKMLKVEHTPTASSVNFQRKLEGYRLLGFAGTAENGAFFASHLQIQDVGLIVENLH